MSTSRKRDIVYIEYKINMMIRVELLFGLVA